MRPVRRFEDFSRDQECHFFVRLTPTLQKPKRGFVKKVFGILGAIALVAVVVFVSVEIYTSRQAAQYKDTAVPYVKMVIPEISTWDSATIKEYMSPESLKGTAEQKIEKITEWLSKLGYLKEMKEPEFSSVYTGIVTSDDIQTIVTYDIEAEYENGHAVITIGLLDNGGSFQVNNFKINSKALSE